MGTNLLGGRFSVTNPEFLTVSSLLWGLKRRSNVAFIANRADPMMKLNQFRALHQERILRPPLDIVLFPDDYLGARPALLKRILRESFFSIHCLFSAQKNESKFLKKSTKVATFIILLRRFISLAWRAFYVSSL